LANCARPLYCLHRFPLASSRLSMYV
jgi:hypothetical protein